MADVSQLQSVAGQISAADASVSRAKSSADVAYIEVGRLNGLVADKQKKIEAATSFRDNQLTPSKDSDDAAQGQIATLGQRLASGMGDDALAEGVRGHVSDNVGTIGDARQACQNLIDRLSSELGDLQSRQTDAQKRLETANTVVASASANARDLRARFAELQQS